MQKCIFLKMPKNQFSGHYFSLNGFMCIYNILFKYYIIYIIMVLLFLGDDRYWSIIGSLRGRNS